MLRSATSSFASSSSSRPVAHRNANVRRPAARSLTLRAVAQVEEVKEEWWNKNSAPNMVNITGVSEFVSALANAGEKLVIADIYASWCGACRGVYPKLTQLANENPDIVVLKINFDDNKAIAKALNIRVLPFFIFYRGAEGQLDAFSASLSKVSRLREAIATHNTPRCSLGPPAGISAFPEIKAKLWTPTDTVGVTRVNPCVGPDCDVSDQTAATNEGELAGAAQ